MKKISLGHLQIDSLSKRINTLLSLASEKKTKFTLPKSSHFLLKTQNCLGGSMAILEAKNYKALGLYF